jgi:hypothetical protein
MPQEPTVFSVKFSPVTLRDPVDALVAFWMVRAGFVPEPERPPRKYR